MKTRKQRIPKIEGRSNCFRGYHGGTSQDMCPICLTPHETDDCAENAYLMRGYRNPLVDRKLLFRKKNGLCVGCGKTPCGCKSKLQPCQHTNHDVKAVEGRKNPQMAAKYTCHCRSCDSLNYRRRTAVKSIKRRDSK